MAIAITAAALGTAKLVAGLIKSSKAKKEAAALAKQRPVYNINPNVQNEVSLAQSELGNGMSAEATSAYEQGIDRDLSSTLDALLKGGGTPNNIAQAFDNSEQGRQRLAMMSDNLRLNQINNLVSAYRNQTNETDKAFQFNQYAPYADKVQANAGARKSASDLTWSGVNDVGSAALSYFGAQKQENLYDKYFGGNNNSGSTISTTPISSLGGSRNVVDIPQTYTNAPQTINSNVQPSINMPAAYPNDFYIPNNNTFIKY